MAELSKYDSVPDKPLEVEHIWVDEVDEMFGGCLLDWADRAIELPSGRVILLTDLWAD
jgi:hypothetical protein